MAHLVIVESPAKARTIGTYLGREYRVTATMGHIRDLPKSGKGLDVEKDFTLHYEPIAGKSDVIRRLREEAAASESVFLATDPDREGEAISWHLKELLGLDDQAVRRVTFNEITQKEVRRSIAEPRGLNYPLIDAQQARRALDRIVGYEISPLLWRKIKSGLSAGRVQSVAVRMVVDRENEIRAFVPKEYWTIEADLRRVKGAGGFKAMYHAPEGQKKAEVPDEAAANAIVNAVRNAPFSVKSVTHTEKRRSPAAPFTTSTLQQEASRKLGMSPRAAMVVAQQLYEGIEVEGHGLTGLITYMRTDSLRLSDDAVADARTFIKGRYGDAYLPKSPRVYKTKAAAQDAHEAIRPSYVELPPEAVKQSLKPEQYKLYKLIWDRFIACQMENARYDQLTIDSVSAGHVFRANHTSLLFSGFTAVYEESRDEEDEAAGGVLPDLSRDEPLELRGLKPEQHFTKPPARYTEASLIRAMEEQGIGRPSTYAPTLSTIVDREYVSRENKQLRPTVLGEVVTGYMSDRFSDIVDVAFTARMEEGLDAVEQGKKDWKSMLSEFYVDFSKSRMAAEEDLKNGRIRIPEEDTGEICELCGGKLVIKMGRFGRYIACNQYPDCKNTRPISEVADGACPLCGGKILKKKSKKGYSYYGCEKGTACGFVTWDTPQRTECPDCGKTLFRVRYAKTPICENPACASFVPEDQRGYRKRSEKSTEGGTEGDTKADGEGKTTPAAGKAKSASAKRPAAKKTGKTTTTAKTKTAKPASRTASGKTAAARKSTSKTAAKSKAKTADGGTAES